MRGKPGIEPGSHLPERCMIPLHYKPMNSPDNSTEFPNSEKWKNDVDVKNFSHLHKVINAKKNLQNSIKITSERKSIKFGVWWSSLLWFIIFYWASARARTKRRHPEGHFFPLFKTVILWGIRVIDRPIGSRSSRRFIAETIHSFRSILWNLIERIQSTSKQTSRPDPSPNTS